MASEPDATVQAVISAFESDRGVTLRIREVLTGGKSGAFVAIVDSSGSRDGVFILKVGSSPDGWKGEETAHRDALDCSAFGGHIPQILLSVTNNGHYGLLLGLAGDSLIRSRPLVNSLGLFGSAYTHFADIAWNHPSFELGDLADIPGILRSTLDYRLAAETGGRILHNTAAVFGHKIVQCNRFAFQDSVFPNPVTFCQQTSPSSMRIRPLYGPTHGDLHSQNLFVIANHAGTVDSVTLIDLASFNSKGLFFFDHAYLELSTLLRQLNNLGDDRWLRLVNSLCQNTNSPLLQPDERGWVSEILAARELVFTRANQDYPNRQDDLWLQFLTAQVAAGLAFLNKVPRGEDGSGGLTNPQYQQAFVWAAVHLRQLIRLTDTVAAATFNSDTSEEIPVLGREIEARTYAPVDLKEFGYFDRSGFNIIAIPETSPTTAQALQAPLSDTAWNIVLDFGTTTPDTDRLTSPSRSFRQVWPGGQRLDPKILNRGGVWISANGRGDISEAVPATTTRDWRKKYHRTIESTLSEIADAIAPPKVRALVLADGFEPEQLRLVLEILDSVFSPPMDSIVVGWHSHIDQIDATSPVTNALLSDISRSLTANRPAIQIENNIALLPRRTGSTIGLETPPDSLIERVERDLTIVHRAKSNSFPEGRTFAVDFHRGMKIEWAELNQSIDITRNALVRLKGQIQDGLSASSNHTVNLLHEPSAGGTTLARRVAWEFMEDFPAVVLNQLSSDTSSYLRDIFQWSSLPLLVIMEATAITESERESLLRQLREDNTRAVFLWVSRVYGHRSDAEVVKSRLDENEAENFLSIYKNYGGTPARLQALQDLTRKVSLAAQRSPFFYGLTAFGTQFLGVTALVEDILERANGVERTLIADLSLVSLYSSEGIPTSEFDEICRSLNGGNRPVEEDSIFLLATNGFVRVSHALLAQRALEALSRNANDWRADIHLHVARLLERLRGLRHRGSDRVQRLVQTLFFTRDIVSALQADTDVQAGAIATQRRFAPLISDLGNVAQARAILRQVIQHWPNEPHYVAHLVRHLLYEEPREIEEAVDLALHLERMPGGNDDSALVHVVGMAFRVRMEQRLGEAVAAKLKLSVVEDDSWSDFEQAAARFSEAALIDQSNEYGLVATIQLVRSLVRLSSEISGYSSVPEFLKDRNNRKYLEAISIAEDAIDTLTDQPHLRLSTRAQRTIAEWQAVYGNLDRVIADLRALASNYEDPGIRRALCAAIIARCKRKWTTIAPADLNTIRLMMERNINDQGVRDTDIRRWLRAYRLTYAFDIGAAIERLADWHKLAPQRVDPAFYLYVFYFIRWISTSGPRQSLADEVNRWLQKCRENRPFGQRAWSFEWLERSRKGYSSVNFNDLGFDPTAIIRAPGHPERARLEGRLARFTGTLKDYRGPQQASLDLGGGIIARITPLDKLSKDDEGKRVSAFISFSYDGLVGWDAKRAE